ncbi:ABC transporter permease [Ideonella azotifigens]|uniref:FtsX-like permease family protein n=2 Tax=Ideonella azotifigens TaxID=513160 RepID=A0ABN1K7F4_9BURK
MPDTSPVSPAASAAVSPSIWRLAARQMLRDFAAGELRLVLVAVVLAVAALSAVGFFADRLQAGLKRDAAQLLGGDLVINSDHPLPPDYVQQAQKQGLVAAHTAQFPSMARAPDSLGGASRLVAVKAVSQGYPLRGALSLQQTANGPAKPGPGMPAAGEVFVDPALAEALALKVGDPLLLGDAQLRIAALIALEPDRGTGFLSFAPRVMLNEADLPATGLVQPASRITYRTLLVAPLGQEKALAPYMAWAQQAIKDQGQRGTRVESLNSGRPEMRQTLDRADKFLNLVALLAALLAAVAVAIAARDFAQRHLDDCAMLRVLGLSQRQIAGIYAIEFGALAVLASLLGVLAGLALHGLFVNLLGSLVPATLPPPGWAPAAFGMGVGITLMLGFGLPPVLQLARVPPLRVIRRELGSIKPLSLGVLLAAGGAFAALLMGVARDLTLGLIAVGGFAAAVGVFALLAWLSVLALRRLVPESRAPRWLVLATRQVAARPAFAVLQVSSLAVGLMALALLVLLRTDLITSWRQSTPPDAPNRFVINIVPEQAEAFRQQLVKEGVTGGDWFPMVRGRLTTINGEPIAERLAQREDARRSVERELNLSYSAQMPAHNQLVAGQWRAGEADGLSVEEGLAKNLGLKLGDVLHFDIGGQPREGKVTSLRKVDWTSMRANFFVMFPVADMPDLPTTFISAFRAPATSGFDNRLTHEFPNVTAVDISATLAQLQQVLDQVIQAVEYLFVFTVAAGLAVLFAALSATREQRAREYAVMRACGASGRLLAQVQRAELLGVGALAGVLASLGAMVVGWALARFAFDFTWTAAPWVPVVGALVGALLALAAGWWGLRELLRRPVMETLRRAGLL